MEGFAATGNNAPAQKLGEADADDFQSACNLVCSRMEHYDGRTVWGCRLFENEVDARKSFG